MKRLISIILVEPENNDNIGAVARAMKNMGLEDLRLVKPPAHWLEKGRKMAMSAVDVLGRAKVFTSLAEATEDIHLIVGTTRRAGPKRGVFIPLDQAVSKIRSISKKSRAAIVFGKESKGLDNSSLSLCDWVTMIPANPEYPSLNLSQAVMVIAFLLYKEIPLKKHYTSLNLLTKKEIREVLRRLKPALLALGYESEGAGVLDRILATFHGIFKRGGLIESEAQMLKGISRRITDAGPVMLQSKKFQQKETKWNSKSS